MRQCVLSSRTRRQQPTVPATKYNKHQAVCALNVSIIILSFQASLPLSIIMAISQCKKCASTAKPSALLALPVEIQLLIIPDLYYPDALALKHTHRHFYGLVDTSIRMKVAWLLDRKERGLEWPQQMCKMKTDALFCVDEVREIMETRRAHGECTVELGGCEVIIGATCGGAKRERRGILLKKFRTSKVRTLRAWPMLWVSGLLAMSLFANICIAVKWYSSNPR